MISIKLSNESHTLRKTWQHSNCGSKPSCDIKGWQSAWTSISFTRWMLFHHVSLQFTAFFHWQQCPSTVYCVQVSPNIAHNVNEHSAFCHFTGWPINYCSLIYIHVNLYVHAVWGETLWKWKVECGNTVNNVCARHGQWNTERGTQRPHIDPHSQLVGVQCLLVHPLLVFLSFPICHIVNVVTERHLWC